jgi:hypothetical protein
MAYKPKILNPLDGGTGISNASASTLTLGGALTTSGAYSSTFTMSAATSVTFPTSGTLATTSQLPGNGLKSLNFTMTNTQIKSSTAVTLVAAQGSGTIIIPLSLTLKMIYGGTNAFTSAPTIYLQYGTSVSSYDIYAVGTLTSFWEATSNYYAYANNLVTSVNPASALENTALTIGFTAPTGNAAANNTLSGNLVYQVLTI